MYRRFDGLPSSQEAPEIVLCFESGKWFFYLGLAAQIANVMCVASVSYIAIYDPELLTTVQDIWTDHNLAEKALLSVVISTQVLGYFLVQPLLTPRIYFDSENEEFLVVSNRYFLPTKSKITRVPLHDVTDIFSSVLYKSKTTGKMMAGLNSTDWVHVTFYRKFFRL